MRKDDFIVVLDIGSEKIICAAGKLENNEISIIALSENYCEGLEKGVVKSIHKTSEIVQKVVEEVEIQTDKRIKNLFVGIKGEHIETNRVRSIINISRTNKEITEEDKKQVLYSVKNQVSVGDDKDILEIIPISYSVDGQDGIIDPKGMEASQLEIEAYVITAAKAVLNNLYKAVNEAGFKIDHICYNQVGLADLCLVPEEKEVGVVLIDMGSKLADISVYKNNRVFFNKEIALGSELIVNDIAYGVRTSLTRARELLAKYGLAYFPEDMKDREISFFAVDGVTERKIAHYTLTEIINARVEEIFNIIGKEFQMNGISYNIPSGIVLTGGAAKLKYIQDVAKEVLNMPVRLGPCQNIKGQKAIISNMSYNTAIGLVQYFYMIDDGETSLFKYARKKVSMFSNFRRKLEKVF